MPVLPAAPVTKNCFRPVCDCIVMPSVGRPNSIAHRETALDVPGLFDFVEVGEREVSVGDVAPAGAVNEELVGADAQAACARAGVDFLA